MLKAVCKLCPLLCFNSGQNRLTLVYDSPLQCYGALNFVHFSIFVYFRPILLLINTLFLIFVQLKYAECVHLYSVDSVLCYSPD